MPHGGAALVGCHDLRLAAERDKLVAEKGDLTVEPAQHGIVLDEL